MGPEQSLINNAWKIREIPCHLEEVFTTMRRLRFTVQSFETYIYLILNGVNV